VNTKKNKGFLNCELLLVLVLSILYMVMPSSFFIFFLLLLFILLPFYYGLLFSSQYNQTGHPYLLHISINSFSVSFLVIFFLVSSSIQYDPALFSSQLLYIQCTILLIVALTILFAPSLVHAPLFRNMTLSFIVIIVTVYAVGSLHNIPFDLLSVQTMEPTRGYIVSLEIISLLLLLALIRLLLYRGKFNKTTRSEIICASVLLLLTLSISFFFQSNVMQFVPLQFIIIFAVLLCLYNSLLQYHVPFSEPSAMSSNDEYNQKVLLFFDELPMGFALFQCKLDHHKKIHAASVLKINKAASTIFDQPKEFVEKSQLNEVLPTIDHLLVEKCKEVFLDSTSKSFRFTHPFSNQTYQISVFPLDNHVLGTIFTNITQQYSLEKEYFEFISTTSHELRTPIVAIKESFQLLMNSWNADKTLPQTQLQGICSRNIGKIQNLVEQILDYQKFTMKEPREKTLEQINDIVMEVYSNLLPVALSRGLKLEFTPCPKLPMIMVNQEGIETILTNLVNNAIKYSLEGTVQIKTAYENNQVVVQIKDEGIGMAEKDIPTIFEPFTRIHSCHRKKINGTGLGLSITNKIIREHNGSIHVDSRENVGSTFTIYLPRT
jgi:nitrogen-specific signal transduction histidine kinase